jgi:hypothetical protein
MDPTDVSDDDGDTAAADPTDVSDSSTDISDGQGVAAGSGGNPSTGLSSDDLLDALLANANGVLGAPTTNTAAGTITIFGTAYSTTSVLLVAGGAFLLLMLLRR